MSKPVSIEKLQAFIEAVEFAADLENPEDWVPTARQWKKIRSMIDALESVAPAPPPPPLQYVQPHAPAPVYRQMAPESVQFSGPSALANADPQMPHHAPPMMHDNGAIPVTTPNLDTSNGNYASSFV